MPPIFFFLRYGYAGWAWSPLWPLVDRSSGTAPRDRSAGSDAPLPRLEEAGVRVATAEPVLELGPPLPPALRRTLPAGDRTTRTFGWSTPGCGGPAAAEGREARDELEKRRRGVDPLPARSRAPAPVDCPPALGRRPGGDGMATSLPTGEASPSAV